MTLHAEIAELLRKVWLRPGEAALCLGVTTAGLRAIRDARPDAWIRYPGMKHDRWRSAVVAELMGGNRVNGDGSMPSLPKSTAS